MSRKSTRRFAVRAAAVVAAGTAAVVVSALPASAHVTITPSTATAGARATLTFNVPTESDTASTTKLDVQFPTDNPIPSVSILPKQGWSYVVHTGAPSKPVTVNGAQVNEVVTEVVWTADGDGIKPGEFDTFTVKAGPMPTGVDSVSFKALQTYSDGSVVRWIQAAQPGQPEPENPAPSVKLTAASDTDDDAVPAATNAPLAAPAASDSDSTARGLGIAGLVVGVLGLGAAAFALVTTRRRPTAGS